MSDKAEGKALELHAQLLEMSEYQRHLDGCKLITSALRSARAEAFAEAAAIARSTRESDLSDEDMEAAGDEAIEAAARSIARRITEAKDKP